MNINCINYGNVFVSEFVVYMISYDIILSYKTAVRQQRGTKRKTDYRQ